MIEINSNDKISENEAIINRLAELGTNPQLATLEEIERANKYCELKQKLEESEIYRLKEPNKREFRMNKIYDEHYGNRVDLKQINIYIFWKKEFESNGNSALACLLQPFRKIFSDWHILATTGPGLIRFGYFSNENIWLAVKLLDIEEERKYTADEVNLKQFPQDTDICLIQKDLMTIEEAEKLPASVVFMANKVDYSDLERVK